MIRKSHLSIAFAGLALFAGSQAIACSTSLWGAGLTGGAGGALGATAGVVAGQPNGGGGGTATRYSGLCGLRADAIGEMVRDGSPASEATYIARFYAHVNLTSGTPVIFRVAEGAPDAAGTPMISIQYNRTNQQFEAVNRTGTVSTIGAAASAPNSRFYHVHLSWTRASGALVVNIKGAGTAALPTANLTGFTPAGSAEIYSELGLVAGPAVGVVNVDAFESRRSTAIPELCRGDANLDGTRTSGDQVQIRNETLNNPAGFLATGQPDCNQDGTITSGDQVCVRNITLAGAAAQPCATGIQ